MTVKNAQFVVELIALLDSLRNSTLNAEQAGVVPAVWDGFLAIARSESVASDVKVRADNNGFLQTT